MNFTFQGGIEWTSQISSRFVSLSRSESTYRWKTGVSGWGEGEACAIKAWCTITKFMRIHTITAFRREIDVPIAVAEAVAVTI